MTRIKRYFQYLYAARRIKNEGTKEKPFGIGLTTMESDLKTAEKQKQEMCEFFDKRGLNGLYEITLFIVKDLYEMVHPKDLFVPNFPEFQGRWVDGVQFHKWEHKIYENGTVKTESEDT